MLKLLLSQFIKKTGRNPNAIEMLQLKFKASQQAIKERKIVNMFDRQPVDANKPILGGKNIIETEEQILQRLKKQNEDSINRLKNKKDTPEELDGGVGLLGERTEYAFGGTGGRTCMLAALIIHLVQLIYHIMHHQHHQSTNISKHTSNWSSSYNRTMESRNDLY